MTSTATATRTATAKQIGFIAKLSAERGVDFDPATWTEGPASRESRAVIDGLLATPRKATAPRATAKPAATDVPEGFFAVPSRTGANDLDFWLVQKPGKGKWAGWTFVKRVLGGHGEPISVRGAEADAALAAISAAGPLAAAALFGQQIGCCSRCRLPLTDLVSRFTGYGPTCRDHVGITAGAETRADAAAWAAANGHADLLAG